MSECYAICIENLYSTDPDKRYLMCTALKGAQKGLVIDAQGNINWKNTEVEGLELCISGDDRLILYLETPFKDTLTVSRGGRSVTAEQKKPVVLLDGDEIYSTSFHYRLHIHGKVNYSNEPSYFTQSSQSSAGKKAATAAVFALTAMMGTSCTGSGSDTKKPEKEKIEVRDQPPSIAPDPEPPKPKEEKKDNNDMKGTEDISSVNVPENKVGASINPPIEVRHAPPVVAPPPMKPPMKPDDKKPMKPPKKPDKDKNGGKNSR
ncbi:hypothetical protein KKF34_06165 [Myxococcota bacterium]|nr:hypothetical protein [Myxococcota bacterium]MBU1496445.1 hypothetical protein [Myxococcota bacterium]